MVSGEIINWERQVKFTLQEGFTYKGKKILPITYIADYVIYWNTGTRTIVDVKGNPDQVAKIKRKLFQYKYPNEDYIWMCRSIKYCEDGSNWLLYEDLEKKRKEDRNNKRKSK